MSDRPNLHAIQQKKFVPEAFEGQFESFPDTPPRSIITVDLGGERLRVLVRKVTDDDHVKVEVVSMPFSKNHSIKHGDVVAAIRVKGLNGRDEWEYDKDAKR